MEYLEKYSRVDHRRYLVYQRIFDKYRDNEGELNVEVRLN